MAVEDVDADVLLSGLFRGRAEGAVDDVVEELAEAGGGLKLRSGGDAGGEGFEISDFFGRAVERGSGEHESEDVSFRRSVSPSKSRSVTVKEMTSTRQL
jgi:hypothetical protein